MAPLPPGGVISCIDQLIISGAIIVPVYSVPILFTSGETYLIIPGVPGLTIKVLSFCCSSDKRQSLRWYSGQSLIREDFIPQYQSLIINPTLGFCMTCRPGQSLMITPSVGPRCSGELRYIMAP